MFKVNGGVGMVSCIKHHDYNLEIKMAGRVWLYT